MRGRPYDAERDTLKDASKDMLVVIEPDIHVRSADAARAIVG
jgi:hypothetical protein